MEDLTSYSLLRKTKFAQSRIETLFTRMGIYSRARSCLTSGVGLQSSACKVSNLKFMKSLVLYSVRFAVRAGAKHVIGVDMSTIIEKAREIVKVNGMESKITLLQGKMEEVKLPFPKIDIILSEWMGYFLLYESMLDTVLYARDNYLVPGGLIFPDKASIYMSGIEDGEYKEEKIGCECPVTCSSLRYELTDHSLGQCLWFRLQSAQRVCASRTPCRYRGTQGMRDRSLPPIHHRPLYRHSTRSSVRSEVQSPGPAKRLRPCADCMVRH